MKRLAGRRREQGEPRATRPLPLRWILLGGGLGLLVAAGLVWQRRGVDAPLGAPIPPASAVEESPVLPLETGISPEPLVPVSPKPQPKSAGEEVPLPLSPSERREGAGGDPFLYEARARTQAASAPQLRVPPVPPLPGLPALPPPPPPVEALAVAGGKEKVVALRVGGEIMTLGAGEGAAWEEGGVRHTLRVRRIWEDRVEVEYDGKRFMLTLGGGR